MEHSKLAQVRLVNLRRRSRSPPLRIKATLAGAAKHEDEDEDGDDADLNLLVARARRAAFLSLARSALTCVTLAAHR